MKNYFYFFAISLLFLLNLEVNASSIWFINPTNGMVIPATGGAATPIVAVNMRYNRTVTGSQTVSYYIKLFTHDNTYQSNVGNGIPQWFYLGVGSYTWRLELWECNVLNQCFKTAEQTITFYIKHDLKVSNNFLAGDVNIDGVPKPSGSSVYKMTGENLLVGAIDQPYGGYYRLWNESGVNNSRWEKKPKDGIFSQIPNGTPRNFNYTVASNDNGAEIRGMMRKRFDISRNNQTEFDGTTSSGVVAQIVEGTSGYITAPSFTLNGRTYNFYQWSDGHQGSPREITPTDHSTYTALYKSPGYSTNQDAYSSNSQRKTTRTINGHLFSIYKSLDKLWLEKSSNDGQSWTMMNNFKPLDNANAPSLDYVPWGGSHSWIGGVYHPLNGAQLKLFFVRTNDPIIPFTFTIGFGFQYENNLTPVIAITNNRILVVVNGWDYQSPEPGLLYFYGEINLVNNNIIINWFQQMQLILNTKQGSKNPTIVADKNAGNIFHIAWEEGSSIKYCKATGSGSSISFTDFATVSTSSGYKNNYNPSISLANGNPIISWTGSVPILEKTIHKENDGLPGAKTIVRHNSADWGDFQVAGNDVKFTNNNSVTASQEKTVIVWSEGSSNPQSKWFKRTNGVYSTPLNLSHSGIETQVITGADYINMTSMVFNNNQQPYFFTKATTNFSESSGGGGGISKITNMSDTVVTFGRAGVVNINGVDFVFNIGDIIVEDSIVAFTDKPDTLIYFSDVELNQYTKSKPFELNASTNFYFSNIYYVVNKEYADSSLTENDNVNFKAELVRVSDEQVVGMFDNINYNLNSLDKYANISYQVDCSGIQPGEYYLRLVTSTEGTTTYALANIMNESTVLEKISGSRQINFTGTEQPLTYELYQNYPNPFNPTTTIRYQVPEDGVVTLKIYDILGKEVATLVNEQKTTGRYEVSFDAGNYASGVYIYRIQVNGTSGSSADGFVSSKKMMLLK